MGRKIREDDFGIAKVEWGTVEMWSQGSNQQVWQMSIANSSVGKVSFETTRERKPDYSGIKQYRIITSHTVTLSLYIGRQEFELREKLYFHGSLKDALKKICEGYQTEHFHRMLRWELEQAATDSGLSKITIWNATDRARDIETELLILKGLVKEG